MIRWLVAAASLMLPCTVHAAWQEASSRHFVVYSDDTPANLAVFTTMLERADKAMRVLHSVDDPAISPMARVTVYVVRDAAAVRRVFGKGGSDVGGFYIPRASGSVAFVPRRDDGAGEMRLSALQVLLHEYAHHFMFSNFGNVVIPAWLTEGFAEFHATTRVNSDGSVVIGEPPLYRTYGILSDSMPLKTLLTAEPGSLKTDEDREVFYGRGWLLTHYLTLDQSRRTQLSQYLAALNRGEPPLEAARVFGDLNVLNTRLNAYTERRLNAFVLPAKMVPIGAVTVRALTPAEAAIMPARIASHRGVDEKTSPAVAQQARALAAPFPTDAAAQNELAEAEFDAGNDDAAQAAAERAYAAEPHSIHAMMYQGLARMAAAAKAHSDDPKRWEDARMWFRKANHADPEYAWPLEMYYLSYIAAKATPTANAGDGLLYARLLAPFDPSLGVTAAYVDLKRDDANAARQVLAPIAYNPHGGGGAIFAQKLLAVIDASGAKAALAAIDEQRDKHGDQPGTNTP